MAYIGPKPSGLRFKATVKQVITGTGATDYALDEAIFSANDIEVFVNNVQQEPNVAYTITNLGTTISFSEAILNTYDCYIVYRRASYANSNTLLSYQDGLFDNVDVNLDLEIPVGDTASRPSPAFNGKIRFNTDINQYEGYYENAVSWNTLGGGAKGGQGDSVFFENDKVVTANYTITTGKNAMTAGPVTINDGVVVTVPDGSRWVIL